MRNKFFAGFGISILVLWMAAIAGWIVNIVDVVVLGMSANPVTTLFVLKVVGIFVAPLGAILGLCDLVS